jgi:putative RNA 2'-phosphotransferase
MSGHIVAADKKGRFEIRNNKIRAVYGHSIKKVALEAEKPPDILYHGTTGKSLDEILQSGIKPMKRKYVHLSLDLETAIIVAKRRTNSPKIIVIDAGKCWMDGIKFYKGSESTWLSEYIDHNYFIKVAEPG